MPAKPSNQDRDNKKRGGHHDRRREPKEFEESTLSVDRVTRVVKGGRRMRFRAIVVVGDKKGKVGLGTGKAGEVQVAVQKATKAAKRHMVKIPLKEGTIPHAVDTKFKAARIRLMPAREGTGIIAGGALRVILEHAGVQNVLSKRFGSTNKLVNAQAVMKALTKLHGVQMETRIGGDDKKPMGERKEKIEDKRMSAAKQDAEVLEESRMQVKEVDRPVDERKKS